MTITIIFIFGLIIGSFLNALIHRLNSGQSIFMDRSKCVHCHTELGALDLVPVLSFFFLGGKCRYCRNKISWQYPIVELITAFSFLLVVYNLQPTIYNFEFWVQLIAVSLLIVVAVFDYKHYLILDKVVIPAFALIVIYNLFTGQVLNGLLGSLIISGFFFLQYLLSKGRWIGLGDVKLGLFLGSLVGWQLSIALLMLGYFMGAVVGLALIFTHKKKMDSAVPFGTFLATSAIITMIYGERILSWYLNTLGI
ncbi:MAG: prepilin peptidase [bacterium]|nr:prepilin peptidase [bacterium]